MASKSQKFAMSTAAGCGATICVHPLDVIRINLQLDSKTNSVYNNNPITCARLTLRQSGLFRGWYAGISGGLFRQLAYGAPRMAIYSSLLDAFKVPGESMPFWKKFGLGTIAGGTAALIGVPSEVCLVRLSADQRLPPDQQRGYTSVPNLLFRVAKEEGFSALWGGWGPTVLRACLLNAGQLGVYSEAKERIHQQSGLTGVGLQFVASLISAFTAVSLSCPADVLKSRTQMAKPGVYEGMLDCAHQTVTAEGPLALWKGFAPAWMKLAPHTVISFIILDNLSRRAFGVDAM